MNRNRSEKTRHWTSAFKRHGKRRGKHLLAWLAWKRLTQRVQRMSDMMDPRDFFGRRR